MASNVHAVGACCRAVVVGACTDDSAAPPSTDVAARCRRTRRVGRRSTRTAPTRDYSPVDGAADVTLAWHRDFEGSVRIGALEWTINLGPTIDPDGTRVPHVDGGGLPPPGPGRSDRRDACGARREVDQFAVASSTLLDRDGRLFVADGEAMHAFDPDGALLWETPLNGVPLSAQFTPEGRLIFVTHIGTVYVLDRDDGRRGPGAGRAGPRRRPGTPAPAWRPAPAAPPSAPSANTLAVDPATGRFFFTFWAPGAAQAGAAGHAVHRGPRAGHHPAVDQRVPARRQRVEPRPVADGTRVYVNDNVDSVHALDARDGRGDLELPHRLRLGRQPVDLARGADHARRGSAGARCSRCATRATAATLAWRARCADQQRHPHPGRGRQGLRHRGRGGRRHRPGRARQRPPGPSSTAEPIPGTSVFSVGTTIGPDGTVYVPTRRRRPRRLPPGTPPGRPDDRH